MKPDRNNSERGVALLMVIFALVLLSAIGLAMMFATNSETGVNSGYRQGQLAYVAARSGVEELRDRVRYTSATNTNGLNDFLPTVPIGQPASVLYVTNLSSIETTAQEFPWKPTFVSGGVTVANPFFDNELCHEIANNTAIPNSDPASYAMPCSNGFPTGTAQIPAGNTWYVQKTAEPLPGNVQLAYKWSRVTLKLNESANPWCVLLHGVTGCAQQTGPDPAADQVCYNGQNEFVLSDARTPIDVPGRVEGVGLPSELAMAVAMFGGGSTGNGNSGHSGTSTGNGNGNAATSSSSSTTTGTSTSSSTTATGTSSSSSTTATGTSSSSSTSGSSSASSSTAGSSSSSSTGLVGTVTGTTGLIGTTSGSSSSSTAGTSTSSTAGTSSSSSTTSGSSTGGGTPAGPSCGVNSPPQPGTPIGVSTTAVQAVSCKAVEAEPVYMLTALAVAPGSTTRRMIQYEVARVPLPPVPAAVTIAGPLAPNPNVTNSGNYFIDGHDLAPVDPVKQCGGLDKPAVGTVSDTGVADATTSMNNFINAIPSNRLGDYRGVDGCQPDVQNVDNTTNSAYSSVDGLQGVVSTIQHAATETYNGDNPTISNLGTDANPQVIVVNGDLSLGAVSGSGILLVTGALTFSGNFSWHGLVMVIGTGVINENGGGNGGITGALVLAKIGDNSGCGTPTGHCYKYNPTDANLVSNPKKLGSPTYNYPGGGTAGFHYDSCMIHDITGAANFTVLARREITY